MMDGSRNNIEDKANHNHHYQGLKATMVVTDDYGGYDDGGYRWLWCKQVSSTKV